MNLLKKLVLIDDDEIFVFLAKKAAAKTNFVELINVFGNGLDALNFFKENSENMELMPDIILLDLSMPVMDGWQFLDEFVNINPKIREKAIIYICTSSISERDIAKAKTISVVTGYIIKPVTKEKMIEIIKKL